MIAPKLGIVGKFLAVVSMIALVLLTGIAVVMTRTCNDALSQQADGFVARLQAMNTEQEKALRQELMESSESMAALLGQIGISLILGYDFAALQQVADSAMKDPHFAFVIFFGKDGKPITKQVAAPKDAQIIKQEIVFGGKKIGSLEMGILMGSITEAIQKISQQIDVTVAESKASRAGTERAIIIKMLLAALVGLLALWLGTYFALRRFVIHPVRSVARSIAGGTEQVATSAGDVSVTSHQLAEGASQQAAAIEETSSSLEEMASMTKNNAENATHANQLMVEANKVVERANRSMTQLTSSMGEISTASEATQKIIKTIDEIAFQTNLLALNAAVEAARAGEAGAGFAVVADEVRNLAMRAAEAARNTAGLIEGTVKKIKEGSELVRKTNQEFSELAITVTKSGELVGEITAASGEQAQGIDQVNRAVCEVDKVTQRNAANAELSASASEEMDAQALQMKGFVAQLVALMGGANGSKAKKPISSRAEREPDAKEFYSGRVLSASAGRSSNGGKESRKALSRTQGSKEIRPEQLIPFDDEDF